MNNQITSPSERKKKQITKLLIANRGEVAVRIIRTAKERGTATAIVYANQEIHALACELSDEAYTLDGITPEETYNSAQKIIACAQRCGAQAIHPGYGFLSEDPTFAQAVEDAGIIWIGPNAKTIRSLGDKIQARTLAANNQVRTIPGISQALNNSQKDLSAVKKFAQLHGLPIVMKQADSGGGRGITVLETSDDIKRFFSERAHTLTSTNTFVEKLFRHCRHVETQCLRDSFGTFAVLDTRDCSVQRRNQKVVEEAPAPFLSDECLSTIKRWSQALFEATDYVGAGTCEFLIDEAGKPYFLEVNPRLQVEHTVTEEITGVDLVEEQLRIAEGHAMSALALRYAVGSGNSTGHSIEVRVTSEDPANDLMPSTGTITCLVWPGGPGVRIDSAMRAGDTIGGDFDSLIAKIIVHAPTRNQAIARMKRALDECQIQGIPTSLPLLRHIIAHPDFQGSTRADTTLTSPDTKQNDAMTALFGVYTKWLEESGVFTQISTDLLEHDKALSSSLSACAVTAPCETVNAALPNLSLPQTSSTGKTILPNDKPFNRQRAIIEVNGQRMELTFPQGLFGNGDPHSASPLRPRQILRDRRASSTVDNAGSPASTDAIAPMQATVIHIAVTTGQTVKEGELLVVLEAMKMEKYIYASTDATIAEVCVSAGTTVQSGQMMVRLDVNSDQSPPSADSLSTNQPLTTETGAKS
ncbi:MAG: biotin carboxylase N-terminal domain-containing protein [Actinomycetaceae bacterium]|nr:biotin carboxylase N-terminal domain-containing protein [Actinomycetaceae bacterium]